MISWKKLGQSIVPFHCIAFFFLCYSFRRSSLATHSRHILNLTWGRLMWIWHGINLEIMQIGLSFFPRWLWLAANPEACKKCTFLLSVVYVSNALCCSGPAVNSDENESRQVQFCAASRVFVASRRGVKNSSRVRFPPTLALLSVLRSCIHLYENKTKSQTAVTLNNIWDASGTVKNAKMWLKLCSQANGTVMWCCDVHESWKIVKSTYITQPSAVN